MRKITVYISLAACTVMLSLLFSNTAEAISVKEYFGMSDTETEKTAKTSGEEAFDDFLDSLPDEVRANIPDSILSNDISSADELLSELSFGKIIAMLADKTLELITSNGISLSALLGVLILSSIIRTASETLGNSARLTNVATSVATALTIVGFGSKMIEAAENFCRLTCGTMSSCVPLLGALYAASGNVTTASVQSSAVTLLAVLCQNIFSIVLIPAIKAVIALGIIGSVFKETGLPRITNVVKKATTWFMLTAMTLFSFLLGIQNTVAQSADTIGVRSLKFAVGNLVPIIGGAVSDSLSAIGGSIALLKSTCGGVAIVIIICVVLPYIVCVAAQKLLLMLLKGVAGILGCNFEEKLIGELDSAASMALAFMISSAVSFVYALTLFTTSSIAISG